MPLSDGCVALGLLGSVVPAIAVWLRGLVGGDVFEGTVLTEGLCDPAGPGWMVQFWVVSGSLLVWEAVPGPPGEKLSSGFRSLSRNWFSVSLAWDRAGSPEFW